MDTWAELRQHLEALEVDASLHPAAADENSDEDASPKAPSTEVVERYEQALKRLTSDIGLLKGILEEKPSEARELVGHIILCVSAHVGSHYWTSSSSRLLARDMLTRLLALCGCSSTLELLVGQPGSCDSDTGARDNHLTSPYVSMTTRAETTTDERSTHETVAAMPNETSVVESEREKEVQNNKSVFSGGIMKPLLKLLRSRLTRETWKAQPTAKHALIWTLRQLKHPHVSPHINSLLPPILMLVDDHEIYHKTLGLSALSHLISNTDPTELRWYGRADVIFEAVKSMQYMREESIISPLHSCLTLLLPVLEGAPPITVTAPRKPTQTDEVFQILLNNIDIESKIALRKAYIAYVSRYIDLLGIYTARHMKQVLKVVYGCVEWPDYCGEHTRSHALKALMTLMHHVWPRVPQHRSDILKMLLKLVSDLCPDHDTIPDKPEVSLQLKLVSECLLTLQHCCGNMEDVYVSLRRDCQGHKGLQLVLEPSLKNMEHRQ